MNIQPRPPAVAGSFYPQSAAALASEVDALLGTAAPATPAGAKAIVVPHAGYVYSGAIAASAYARLAALPEAARRAIRRVVLLGPTHRVAVRGVALPDCSAFETPLGAVPIDTTAIALLADLPQVVVSAAAHAQEHALEVQLPFLQKVLGDFSLLPLAVGDASAAEVAAVIERLWGGDETLFVVSSDLSHYLPYAVAQQADARTVGRILALATTIDHREACGASPLNGFLLAARRHGLRGELVDLRNSGDTAGDKARVVGYAAFVFAEPTPGARDGA